MECKVVLSPRAIHLSEIVRYIALDNPQIAEQHGYNLIDAALSLNKLSERGRFVPEFGDEITREIIVGSYRIIYRVDFDKNVVNVSRFWHSSRLLRP
jgi:toxin ParE1/3/4